MKDYQKPRFEILQFEISDVICTSGLPTIEGGPTGDYEDDYSNLFQ